MIPWVIAFLGVIVGCVLMLSNEWVAGAAVVVGSVGLPMVMRRAETMVYLVLVATTVSLEVAPGLTPVKFLGAVALFVIAFRRDVSAAWRLPPVGFSVAVVSYFGWALIAELLNVSERSTASFVTMVSTLLIILMLSTIIRRTSQIREVSVALAANLALVGGSVLAYVPWSSLNDASVRSGGIAAEANSLGEVVARLMPFATALLSDSRNPWHQRLFGGLAIGAGLLGMFVSSSRGGTIALVAGMITYSLVSSPSFRSFIGSVAGASAILASGVYFAPVSYTVRVLGAFGIGEYAGQIQGDVTSGRLELNNAALDFISDNPLFGVGHSGFVNIRASRLGVSTVVHNGPLSVMVAYGVPIIVPYIAANVLAIRAGVKALRRLLRYRHDLAACIASWAAAIVSSQSLTDLNRSAPWIAPLLLVLYWRAAQDEDAAMIAAGSTERRPQPRPLDAAPTPAPAVQAAAFGSPAYAPSNTPVLNAADTASSTA